MKIIKSILFVFSFFISSFSNAVIHQNSSTVHIKVDCTGIDNCFEDMASLTEWAWGTQVGVEHRVPAPNQNSRLLVLIGEGEFGQIRCVNTDTNSLKGFVTFSGTGKGSTVLNVVNRPVTVKVQNCTDLNFNHMTIDHSSDKLVNKTIEWVGNGKSIWDNVEVINSSTGLNSTNYGWYDLSCDSSNENNTHFWFGSTVKAVARKLTRAYKSNCAETWFYGGLIEVFFDNGSAPSAVVGVETVGGDVRVFGSTVRVHVPSSALASDMSGITTFTGVSNSSSGVFHMHGGIISLDASRVTGVFNSVGLSSSDNAAIAHTPGTAFAVLPSINGSATRVTGSTVKSPYLWPPGVSLPVEQSVTGADIFVETDCDAMGYCEGDGSEVHMMIYNDTECVNQKWFDTRTNQCRMVGSNPNI